MRIKLKESEHDIQDAVIDLLTMHGYYVERRNTGIVKSETGGYVRLSPPGTPDIMAFKPMNKKPNTPINAGGVYLLELEVKIPGKDATPLQNEKMREMTGFGANCHVVHSVEEALKYI